MRKDAPRRAVLFTCPIKWESSHEQGGCWLIYASTRLATFHELRGE